jgi:hypothetical protein
MHRRLSITLPEETVRLIERVAPKGVRSRFAHDVRDFVPPRRGKAHLVSFAPLLGAEIRKTRRGALN